MKEKILHQFKTGNYSLAEFVRIALKLGYPMVEWNGIVYKTPSPNQRLQDCKIGKYSDLFNCFSPVYKGDFDPAIASKL